MKKKLKKIWWFIWEDNSIWSWIVNIILAFMLVKFIIYPLLGFLLSTSYPVVAVLSGSMEHNEGFNDWWDSNNNFYDEFDITKEDFRNFRFKNGFNEGDVMVLRGVDNINIGDVIVFWGDASEPIIHRVIKLDPLQTKGDNYLTNTDSRPDEVGIKKDKVLGKAIFRIPYVGWVKLIFVKIINLLR